VPLLQGTPLLHNDLTLLLLRTPKRNGNAGWFVPWVTSYRGRDAIARYRYDGGRPLFVRER
jgi:ABC-type tungstate transport system permease subunit